MKRENKRQVTVVIHKIASYAPKESLQNYGEMICTYVRRNTTESTPPFHINEPIEHKFTFISTFILTEHKENSFKEKDLHLIITSPNKKKTYLDSSINLTSLIDKPAIQQSKCFTIKSIPMELSFTISIEAFDVSIPPRDGKAERGDEKLKTNILLKTTTASSSMPSAKSGRADTKQNPLVISESKHGVDYENILGSSRSAVPKVYSRDGVSSCRQVSENQRQV